MPAADDRSTRETLIDAAEKVFAADGFERASMRAVMREADANPAAVHYHFGGKDGLLEAVLDRAVSPITERRLELLEDLRRSTPTGPLPLRPTMVAFLEPDLEAIEVLKDRGPGRAALVGRAYAQPTDQVQALMYRQFDPVATAFIPEVTAALPHLSPDLVRWRFRWCVVGVIVAMFNGADQPDGPIDLSSADARQRTLDRIVDFVVAGLSAESP